MSKVKGYTIEDLTKVDAFLWADGKVRLGGGVVYSAQGHAYQVEPMQSDAKKTVGKKGAQMGWTEIYVLKTTHGLIHHRYPKGALYLFPTMDDVADFSRGRWAPLITANPGLIGQYVRDTDATGIKNIAGAFLYLRGARSTQRVEGVKKDSSKLRTIPVDALVLDEEDLMDPAMIEMALERFSHSAVQEEHHLSTPTIPDFGVDKLYNESDQRIWIIRCPKCRRDCCLELDFPACVQQRPDGVWYRACAHCGAELNPMDGFWVAQYPGREWEGRWISQLNSLTVDPGLILEKFENPPNGNPQEVYNSKLAMAWIAAENRLTKQMVYECCGPDAIESKDFGPCAMGVDVGKGLHVTIGKKLEGGRPQVVYIGQVGEFPDLVDLTTRFNVKCMVIDLYPETRAVRALQKTLADKGIQVFGCQYEDRVKQGEITDEAAGVITVSRTEQCDGTHNLIANVLVTLPRRCPTVEDFALHCSNLVKILQEDERTGLKIFRYKKTGPDHFRHSFNYLNMALAQVGEASSQPPWEQGKDAKPEEYDPLAEMSQIRGSN